MDNDEIERNIHMFMDRNDIKNSIQDMINRNNKRLEVSLDKVREFSPQLANLIIKKPNNILLLFEDQLNNIVEQDDLFINNKNKKLKNNEKIDGNIKYKITFSGNFGSNMVGPRGLGANLANQLVCVQGVITRTSVPRNLLTCSYHYCEETKQGIVKEYNDTYSITNRGAFSSNTNNIGVSLNNNSNTNNSVPLKDNNGNSLSFEYGLSKFKDFQMILIQEPPERTPAGQLPRSVEVILEDDLVDKVKPGDRIQVVGMYKFIASQGSMMTGNFKTVLISTNISSISDEINVPKLTGIDIREIRKISQNSNVLELLSNSIAPSIFGSNEIKKALILQLLGGNEKNLDNGTHLRGDINILLIGDPSTAKSQCLRHMLSLAPTSVATTGRGSTGVGLTAAVIVDKDTGERNLEAGAMVLADRGIVCIDEFDKMNEVDRVSIHEVMEQQTVTIAKAGIHVQLNARCSVLAAANPIYGEYQKDLSASKNIGMPDSLLSRFDLVFIVLDNEDSAIDRMIADRVIKNHMLPIEIPSLITAFDEKIIEPDIKGEENDNDQIFEKFNILTHFNKKQELLTKNFLKKYLYFAKKTVDPQLTEEANEYIIQSWVKLRDLYNNEETKKSVCVPITIRTLETLIRLSTAHAKLRLSKYVNIQDSKAAEHLLKFTVLNELNKDKDNNLNTNNIKYKSISSINNISNSKIITENNKNKELTNIELEKISNNEQAFSEQLIKAKISNNSDSLFIENKEAANCIKTKESNKHDKNKNNNRYLQCSNKLLIEDVKKCVNKQFLKLEKIKKLETGYVLTDDLMKEVVNNNPTNIENKEELIYLLRMLQDENILMLVNNENEIYRI